MIRLVTTLALGFAIGMNGQGEATPKIRDVSVELSTTTVQNQLHWRIDNKSGVPVYVYSFYLWGPAYTTEMKPGITLLETSPTAPEGGCPNRFPPVLLLLVPPGDYREGDFRDQRLQELNGKRVALEIGVGADPYTVVKNADAIRWNSKDCTKSPMDAIWEWSTVIVSGPVTVPSP